MSQQPGLDVLLLERFREQWVVLQVQHTQAQVEGGMEVAGELIELLLAEWLLVDGRASLAVDGPPFRIGGQVVQRLV